MSKKKNTLKDLDDFLKQQAAVIVPPTALSEKVEEPVVVSEVISPPVNEVLEEKEEKKAQKKIEKEEEVSAEKIIEELNALAQKDGTAIRSTLYDIIIRSLASTTTSPEDKMLINTALYLKSGDNWKDVIREYWRGRK
jgi:hypothetical protein